MDTHQEHQDLVNEYRDSVGVVRKYAISMWGLVLVVWGALLYLRNSQLPHINWVIIALLVTLLFAQVTISIVRKKLENRMNRIILEGFRLEMHDPKLDVFFHQILKLFKIAPIIITRALLDGLTAYVFLYGVYQICLNFHSSFPTTDHGLYGIVAAILFSLKKHYYMPFKPILIAKRIVS